VAGGGTVCCAGNGDTGPAISATIWNPGPLAISADGTLYLAEKRYSTIGQAYYSVIRLVGPDGNIATFAGKESGVPPADGVSASRISLPVITAITFFNNWLYVASSCGIGALDGKGFFHNIAGSFSNCGFAGDGGPAVTAQFDGIASIAFDLAGDLYVADSNNNRVRKLTPVSQTPGCTLSTSETSVTVPASGGTMSISVATAPSCIWLTSSGVAWLTVAQPGYGIGVGSVTFTVVANPGAQRITSLKIGQTPISITQAGGPVISLILNAATFRTGGIAPNEFITVTGTGLGSVAGATGSLATSLSGTTVYVGGVPAPLTYAQDGQVNAVVPWEPTGSSTTVQVEYAGAKSALVTVPLTASAPGIFTGNYGPGQASVLNQDGTLNTSKNPATRGSYIAFWATGQGLVDIAQHDGSQPTGPPFPNPLLSVGVSLGGMAVPSEDLVFKGLVYAGVLQVNIRVPDNAPTGQTVALLLTIGSASSRTDVTMAIQ